jgi:peptidoglycan hydrolase-like amidase/peptidoglycan hydrolase CwlO-like protein
MKKIIALFLILLTFFLYALPLSLYPIQADEIEDLQKQIDELNKAREQSLAATKPLEGQLDSLKRQLAQIQASVTNLSINIKNKQVDLDKREDSLASQQALLEQRVRAYYVRSYLTSPMLVIFSKGNAGDVFRNLSYAQTVTKEDRQIITSITGEVTDLLTQKEKLEKDKASLASLQIQVDKNAGFLGGEIDKAKKYQTDLGNKIAEISAKQQEILAARSGQFTASIGDSEEADDLKASIKGFREQAPAGSFAVFSFGAFTHRKGMSQYGARGRAQSGQDYKAILKAYYGKEPVQKDTGGDINVVGFGSINFEEKYLYGIAEMPSGWHPEALKAQAVAARTYAYRSKQSGQAICTTEACQVFNKSKADNPPDAWKAAVNATRGMVIEDVVTYFASTHGVFTTTSGWDTTDGSGGSNFVDKSYEKVGGSPWVYKAWYTQGYSVSSDKCGRSNPWLNGEEMADLVNAALVLSKGSSEEASRITPISSCWGGNPYSHDELKNVASKYGGISNASSVSVVQGNGTTNQVSINGVTLSGADFKKAFNLRAPGRLSIPQSGFAFFNIEKK